MAALQPEKIGEKAVFQFKRDTQFVVTPQVFIAPA
jgi:hypothetical protein